RTAPRPGAGGRSSRAPERCPDTWDSGSAGSETMRDAGHVRRNRELWDEWSGQYLDAGRRAWGSDEPNWGIWSVPERDLEVLGGVAGKDVLELGCGTAYWSAWLAGRGARVVGLDNSARQLAHARLLQREHGLAFPLIQANAEAVPLADGRFDLVLSEYGGMLWGDPYRTVPEAARLLRPGGLLVFLTNGTLLNLCSPVDAAAAGETLVNDYLGMHRFEDPRDGSVAFQLPFGEWIRLFRANGLAVEDLIELRPPEGASPGHWSFVTLEWARRWPSEEIWK